MRLKPGVVCIDLGMRLKIRLVEDQVRDVGCEVLRYDSWWQRARRGLGDERHCFGLCAMIWLWPQRIYKYCMYSSS